MDHKKFRYTTTHGLIITTTLGDITKVTADAVVTGDGCYLDKESSVTVALQSAFPKVKDVRRRLREEYAKLDLWTVKSRPLGCRFKYVIFAILTNGSDESWVKNMKTLYQKIFKEADSLEILVIALPLLGAGKDETERSLSIQAFVTSALQYRPRYLTDIMIVNNNSKVLDMIHTQIMFEESGISEPSEQFFSGGLKKLKDWLSPSADEEQQPYRHNWRGTRQQGRGGHQRHFEDRASHASAHSSYHKNNNNKQNSRVTNNNTSCSRSGGKYIHPKQAKPAYCEDERQLQKALKDDTNRKHSHSHQASFEEQHQIEMAIQISKHEVSNRKHHQFLNHSISRGEDAELQIALHSKEEAAAKKFAESFHVDPVQSGTSENNTKASRRNNEERTFAGVRSSDTDAECNICMVNPVDCVFVDCGHMVSCLRCAQNLSVCPVCRKSIEKALKVYKS